MSAKIKTNMIQLKISKRNLLRGKGIDSLEGRIQRVALFLARRNGVSKYTPHLIVGSKNVENRVELK